MNSDDHQWTEQQLAAICGMVSGTVAATDGSSGDKSTMAQDAYDKNPRFQRARRIRAMTVEDMPPEPDDMGMLLDTAQEWLNLPSRNAVWRKIGIDPRLGRSYLTRQSDRVTWPVFKTLRDLAFPYSELEEAAARNREINEA